MKYSLILIAVFLVGCNSRSELEKLNAELEVQKKQNLTLEKRLSRYENALVIPAENLHRYLISVTFGEPKANPDGESAFSTYLVLSHLPPNIKMEWECSPEAMKVEHDGLVYHVANFYETGRATEFKGSYTMTFPNGEKKQMRWLKPATLDELKIP